MKTSIYWTAVITLFVASYAKSMTITDVQISPEQPSIFDVITIESKGAFSGGTNWFNTSVFYIDDFSLQLNLYFTGGSGPQIPQPWSRDEVIGLLPQGNYDLSVQAYWRISEGANYILHDDYSTNFEVVPEPLTLCFLTLGIVFIRRK